MTKVDAAIEDLKALPPSNLERAADYIHRLKLINDQERHAIIDRTAGSLTREEADELERIIAEGCEQLDEQD
jgi:2,3-bisphosphoglycerate-independent phosphoglycerate mutase